MGKMSEPGIRKFSTNHLMGEGYWVWLIPLSTGPISIGVCADPRVHPFEEISELERMMEWLKRHEPQLAAAVEPRLGDVEDFLRVRGLRLRRRAGLLARPVVRWWARRARSPTRSTRPAPTSSATGTRSRGDLIQRDLDGRGHLRAPRVLQRLLLPHLRLRALERTRTSTRSSATPGSPTTSSSGTRTSTTPAT